MSGNAALAAAKRRRNPGGNEIMSDSSDRVSGLAQTDQKPRTLPNIQVLVLEHDRRLFKLEKETNVNKLETSITTDTSHLEKLITNTTAELKLLKTTSQKQLKINQELSSQTVLLKASLATQTTEINKMKSLMEEMETLMKNTGNLTPISEEDAPDESTSKESASRDDTEVINDKTEQLTLEVTESETA